MFLFLITAITNMVISQCGKNYNVIDLGGCISEL